MSNRQGSRSVDLSDVLRGVETSRAARNTPTDNARRRLLADYIKGIFATFEDKPAAKPPTDHRLTGLDPADDPGLSPRMLQTLRCLLQGDSEKQIAAKLGISPHTIHVYVKSIYKHYNVFSRAELLAKWVQWPSATI